MLKINLLYILKLNKKIKLILSFFYLFFFYKINNLKKRIKLF